MIRVFIVDDHPVVIEGIHSILQNEEDIEWVGDALTGHLRLLDQTRLPEEEFHIDCRDAQAVWDAIKWFGGKA